MRDDCWYVIISAWWLRFFWIITISHSSPKGTVDRHSKSQPGNFICTKSCVFHSVADYIYLNAAISHPLSPFVYSSYYTLGGEWEGGSEWYEAPQPTHLSNVLRLLYLSSVWHFPRLPTAIWLSHGTRKSQRPQWENEHCHTRCSEEPTDIASIINNTLTTVLYFRKYTFGLLPPKQFLHQI